MESLVNYGSDDESGDCNDIGKNDMRSRKRQEEDDNYDEIGMDESSEESNNNHAEGHFSTVAREKQGETSRPQSFRDCDEGGWKQNHGDYEIDRETKCKAKNDEDCHDAFGQINPQQGYSSKSNEEIQRRHSSDMEMDDGEDDLDNYKNVELEETKYVEAAADIRQKMPMKNVDFTKGNDLETESAKKCESFNSAGIQTKSSSSKSVVSQDSRTGLVEKNSVPEEIQRSREENVRQRDRGKDLEDRRKDEYRRKDDRDSRRKEDERWKDNDRDRKRECEKYRDDKDRERKRSPDRREHGKKRSYSPDRRDRDREYDRDRDKERDRERDRDYRSSDRRSPKHSRRSSRSPERSWKARKLEKKAAVLNKLGIEIKTDITGNMTPRQLLGEQLKAQIQEVEAKTGVTLPTYYNPGVMNPLKYAQQIQKRKLLWGNKSAEAKKNESTSQSSTVPSTVKQWEAATFKGDNDGKMTEKFKRLMGIKGDSAVGSAAPSGTNPPETKEIIQKQEEMFSNMEAQYQVARMATHTHRGVGLGFGTFQMPPR